MEFRHKLLFSIFRVGTGGDGLPFGSLVMSLFFGRKRSWKWASRSDVNVVKGLWGSLSIQEVYLVSNFTMDLGLGILDGDQWVEEDDGFTTRLYASGPFFSSSIGRVFCRQFSGCFPAGFSGGPMLSEYRENEEGSAKEGDGSERYSPLRGTGGSVESKRKGEVAVDVNKGDMGDSIKAPVPWFLRYLEIVILQ
ncbi:hypothetical protein U1Q18_003324 [Sarracenia purpurea var. burkii]